MALREECPAGAALRILVKNLLYIKAVKKLRGQRRHLRRALRWQQSPPPLDLNSAGYDCRKIWLRPWSDLYFTRLPPTVIRRELLRGLLITHTEWRQTLQRNGEPFYLAIWLFEHPFRETQIAAGINERIQRYETIFEDGPPRPLPPEYQLIPGIEELEWRTYWEVHADYERPFWPVRDYRQERMDDGEIVHVWHGSRVWVGRWRG